MGSPLLEHYQQILNRIQTVCAQVGRNSAEITLIAVSKTHSTEKIEALYRAGHRDFGESYVQELIGKAKALSERGCSSIRWHFIGHLQTNKVKALLPWVHTIHSVNSEKLGLELAKRWRALELPHPLPVFIEVNIDEEKSKSGVEPAEIGPLAKKLSAFKELQIAGLMCIPSPKECGTSEAFKCMQDLEKTCRPYSGSFLSMGMTDDFEDALRTGATHLRIGTAIFGAREPKTG